MSMLERFDSKPESVDQRLEEVGDETQNSLKSLQADVEENEEISQSLMDNISNYSEYSDVEENEEISQSLMKNISNYLKYSNQVIFVDCKQNFIPKFESIKVENGKITGQLTSYGKNETIEISYTGDTIDKIKIVGLNKEYTDCYEGFRTANLINFMKNNKKQYPQGSIYSKLGFNVGTYGEYIWQDGEIRRKINLFPKSKVFRKCGSVERILSEGTINQYFPSLKKQEVYSFLIDSLNESGND